MRTQLKHSTQKESKSDKIENINSLQRMQLEQILKYSLQQIAVFDFDDTSETYEEGITDKTKALSSFQIILMPNITTQQKQALKSWGTLDSVEEIRKILYHPNPHGVSSGVAGGLLNLVRYNNESVPSITKEAVQQYIQFEVKRRMDILHADGIEPAEYPKIDLRSAIDKIDNKRLKELFLNNYDACKKLIDINVSFDALCQMGIENHYALKKLLQNVDAAIYLIKNKHLTFKQISELGIKDFVCLRYLLKNHKTYISYVERNFTTFEKLIDCSISSSFNEGLKALGKYNKSVEKLLKLGVSFDALYQLCMEGGWVLKELLSNINSEKSQKWINSHSIVIKQQQLESSDAGRYFLQEVNKLENIDKKHLCILNGLLLLNFISKSNNVTVDTILKLPLNVLKEFDNSKNYHIVTDALRSIEKVFSEIARENSDFIGI